jgi:trehalose 6-phosphate phosphatase
VAPDGTEPMLRAVAATTDSLLARLASDPQRAGLFLDFDGVLAPIVPRPEEAALPVESAGVLRRLVARYRLVSIVSGRAGDDVRSRVDVDGIVYVGSHGLELTPEADRWRTTLATFAADALWPPAQTELKGLGVSFHYRGRADEHEATRELDAIANEARERGLVARYGRKILEVLPPVDANKGTAVRRLLAEHGLRRALAAGDDTTDIDSFRALDGLETWSSPTQTRSSSSCGGCSARRRRCAGERAVTFRRAGRAAVERRDQRRRVGTRDPQPG